MRRQRASTLLDLQRCCGASCRCAATAMPADRAERPARACPAVHHSLPHGTGGLHQCLTIRSSLPNACLWLLPVLLLTCVQEGKQRERALQTFMGTLACVKEAQAIAPAMEAGHLMLQLLPIPDGLLSQNASGTGIVSVNILAVLQVRACLVVWREGVSRQERLSLMCACGRAHAPVSPVCDRPPSQLAVLPQALVPLRRACS